MLLRRRRMKGGEDPEMMIGTIIFVVGLGIMLILLLSRYTQVSAVVKTSENSIEMINVAHYAKKCFSVDDVLREDLMTSARKLECQLSGYVCIADIETGRKWLDCAKVDNPMHDIHAPLLLSSGEIHTGDISVQS